MKSILRIALGGLCLAAIGCRTTSIKGIENIPILEGVSTSEAVEAILAVAIAPEGAKRRLPPPPFRAYEDGRWTVEDSTEDSAILCYSLGIHSVRVKFAVVDREIVPTVLSSAHLRQSKRRIHKNAVVWINRLSPAIREAMWRAKVSATPQG